MKSAVLVLYFAGLYLASLAADKNCDTLGVNFYRAIGCEKSGTHEGCPTYEKCEYSQPIGHCKYQGHKIDKGEGVKNVVQDSSCNFGCICAAADGEKGKFICAQGQCGHFDEVLQGKSNCFLRYSLDSCCPNPEPVCRDDGPATCTVGDEKYKEGQRFSPKGQCTTCLCTKDFDGKFDGPNCKPTPCDVELRHSKEIEDNCAPLYFIGDKSEALCCPVDFVCPSKVDVVKENESSTSDKVCKYGLKTLKLGSTIESENKNFGDRKVSCECMSPPLMTCTMTYH